VEYVLQVPGGEDEPVSVSTRPFYEVNTHTNTLKQGPFDTQKTDENNHHVLEHLQDMCGTVWQVPGGEGEPVSVSTRPFHKVNTCTNTLK